MPPGHARGGFVSRVSSRRCGAIGTNSPSLESSALRPGEPAEEVDHDVPAAVRVERDAGRRDGCDRRRRHRLTGAVRVEERGHLERRAGRARRQESRHRLADAGDVDAIAEASAGTPSGSGTVSSPPGGSTPANGPSSRVSTRRRVATGTKRPARDWAVATNAPGDVDDQVARHVLVELDRAARAELDDRRVGDGAVGSRVEHGDERPGGAARVERDEAGVGRLRRRDGDRDGDRASGTPGRPATAISIVAGSSRMHPQSARRVSASRYGVIATYADVDDAAAAVCGTAAGATSAVAVIANTASTSRTPTRGLPRTCCPTLPLMSASSSTDGSPEPQVCVVTGANSGIGRATAVHLAESGYTVFGTVRSRSKADKLNTAAAAAGVMVELVELDIADDESVARRLRRDPRSQSAESTISSTTPAWAATASSRRRHPQRMLDVLNVDVCGGLRCIREVLPGMRERGAGHDRQHHVGRRSHRRRRPGAVRGVEVGVRGAERATRPGAGRRSASGWRSSSRA